ncbi:MAG: fumarate reductase subunit C [Succinivibrio sp.]|nr:fumarate reductase subunit C [Succinivibrio sp.]MCI5577045.1 fumarate reductase subunit C [Succinivibrio sp.]MCI7773882.1 fumarate reductase subunit C [Succinivibrio sp.]MCI7785829.1 fumarate reductase subunit C [Succinivibrio sp.]MDY5188188.1 fumarate reductase subunit C [Succinivibrio sp.]
MSEVKSFRKPYNPPVKKMTWWLENPFYIFYMVREGTAVLALFAVLEILFGIFMLALCELTPNQSLTGVAPYVWYLQNFLGNPVIIALNVIILVSQLFHAVTWFALMPKAVRVFMNKNSTELLPEWVTKVALYLGLVGATVVILAVAYLTK